MQLLRQLAEKLFGRNVDLYHVDCVRIRGGFFEMCPNTWSDSNWAIDATVSPALVSIMYATKL